MRVGGDSEAKWLMLAGVALHAIVAWASVGWLHPDEYYQTLEFAGQRLGLVPKERLAWEYAAEMRPWMQPLAYAAVMMGGAFLGLGYSAYSMLLCRILSSLVGLVSAWGIARSFVPRNKADQILWWSWWMVGPFAAFFHARTSSENLAASCLTFAMIPMLRMWPTLGVEKGVGEGPQESRTPLVLTTTMYLALGFGCAVRYQMLLFVAGVFLWGVLRGRWRDHLVGGILGGGAVALLSLILDRVGYGHWVVAPYRYYLENIFYDKASQFGVSPFWGYWTALQQATGPFAATLIVGVFARFLILNLGHPVAWGAIVFVLGHCLIAHKELRFLFPLLPLLTWACYDAMRDALRILPSGFWRLRIARTVAILGILTTLAFDFRHLIDGFYVLERVNMDRGTFRAEILHYGRLQVALGNNPDSLRPNLLLRDISLVPISDLNAMPEVVSEPEVRRYFFFRGHLAQLISSFKKIPCKDPIHNRMLWGIRTLWPRLGETDDVRVLFRCS